MSTLGSRNKARMCLSDLDAKNQRHFWLRPISIKPGFLDSIQDDSVMSQNPWPGSTAHLTFIPRPLGLRIRDSRAVAKEMVMSSKWTGSSNLMCLCCLVHSIPKARECRFSC